jgi:hypothetical protein
VTVDPRAERAGSAGKHRGGAVRPPLRAAPRPAHLPLSAAQQRVWFVDRLERGSVQFNRPETWYLRGPLDRAALARAVSRIVERHEILRTRFVEIAGAPVQIVDPPRADGMSFQDLSHLDPEPQAAAVSEALTSAATAPFDLAEEPALRTLLLRVADDRHVLGRVCHHIVFDAWSQAIFNHELGALYAAFHEGLPDPLPPLSVQYADFAIWQGTGPDQRALEDGIAYWRQQLAGLPEELGLPADGERARGTMRHADACETTLDAAALTALRAVAREEASTLFMAVLAALGLLLARYTGHDDVAIAAPIATRHDEQLERVIGLFVNSLVMRIRISPGQCFRQLLADVRRTALDAYRHQDVPFERLVEALAPRRTALRAPLAQVSLDFQNTPQVEPRLAGLDVESLPARDLLVRADLETHAWESPTGLRVVWLYDRDVFERWRIGQMARHLGFVLGWVACHPQRSLDEMDLLDSEEQHRILIEWNQTAGGAGAAAAAKG